MQPGWACMRSCEPMPCHGMDAARTHACAWLARPCPAGRTPRRARRTRASGARRWSACGMRRCAPGSQRSRRRRYAEASARVQAKASKEDGRRDGGELWLCRGGREWRRHRSTRCADLDCSSWIVRDGVAGAAALKQRSESVGALLQIAARRALSPHSMRRPEAGLQQGWLTFV